ncbi:hypothetical protein FOIG_13491 [Fusarium odoratissimum NRRL 54006]|uniref:Uncharacterized protein n=1 Tax=Fusarium odoratissimum (strain NRRL 54006) TaxID=1089451 RepID=X0K9G6_FUSO5|nr:uncharacterized protein FOIG_13491 [Fusarium odoratissimum NRRL 54006]EXL93644.1 hypothetical protein FOIG_13491 [Fusarium odoratissimum NRRL 54006]
MVSRGRKSRSPQYQGVWGCPRCETPTEMQGAQAATHDTRCTGSVQIIAISRATSSPSVQPQHPESISQARLQMPPCPNVGVRMMILTAFLSFVFPCDQESSVLLAGSCLITQQRNLLVSRIGYYTKVSK